MLFERIESPGIAHYSYLIGDGAEGVAAVIDPRRDVEVYLELARRNQVRITHILETHIHADFVSGSRELAARTGARIYGGATDDGYGFDIQMLREGDEIRIGEYRLEVLHTPGHTPEHICYLISGGSRAEAPWGVFSGDTLFAGDVGRPDLLGSENEVPLARRLFETLHEKLFALPDDLVIYPAHGEGSPCGAEIGDRPLTTLGYEKRNNSLLQVEERDDFVRQLLAAQDPAPAYYPRMKHTNWEGPAVLGALPYWAPLGAQAVRESQEQDEALVVDAREIVDFGGGHIPGALNIALRSAFPIWAGRLLEPERKLLLVLPAPEDVSEARVQLLRVGLENVAGYLHQGMRGWTEAGQRFATLPMMSVQSLHERLDDDRLQILDVRSDSEWAAGRIPGAQHIFLPELKARMDELDPERPVSVYCGSGYRATMAASILQRHGFRQVSSVPGSMDAWNACGYELEE